MGGKKPLRRPLWPPTRATASNYYPLGLDGAGGAAKPLLRAPKKPAPLHGRLPAFSGAVDAFERARKCFLEWRYFFSIILSEFLKNRVALHLAYVPVPKDLSKVKTKVAFNLTKRQIVCFAAALLIGLPLFFLLKGSAGTNLAAMAMIVVMLPCFLLAMYEKHGQPLEVVVRNVVQTKFTRPKERPYRTENLYAVLEKQRKLEKEVSAIVKRTNKKDAGSRRKQA